MFDRVPHHVHAGAEFLVGGEQVFREGGKFIGALEWRVYENQPAFFRRREERAQGLVAVALMHRNAGHVAEVAPQYGRVLGVQFAGHQPVLRAQQRGGDGGGAGVEAKLFDQRGVFRQCRVARGQHLACLLYTSRCV